MKSNAFPTLAIAILAAIVVEGQFINYSKFCGKDVPVAAAFKPHICFHSEDGPVSFDNPTASAIAEVAFAPNSRTDFVVIFSQEATVEDNEVHLTTKNYVMKVTPNPDGPLCPSYTIVRKGDDKQAVDAGNRCGRKNDVVEIPRYRKPEKDRSSEHNGLSGNGALGKRLLSIR